MKRLTADQLARMKLVLMGGEGSGNFGHAGRPGKVGGSQSSKSEIKWNPLNQERLNRIAGRFLIPENTVIISDDESDDVASFNKFTKKITIYSKNISGDLNDDRVLAGIIAHENTHAMFQEITQIAIMENRLHQKGKNYEMWVKLNSYNWEDESKFSAYANSYWSGKRDTGSMLAVNETLAEAARYANYGRRDEVPDEVLNALTELTLQHLENIK